MRNWIHAAGVAAMAVTGGCMDKAEEEAKAEYTLQVSPASSPEAGEPVRLDLDIRDRWGNQVDDVEVVHEKRYHILVMPPELDFFAHLHGDENGARMPDDSKVPPVEVTFPRGGEYRVFVEFQPAGADHSEVVSATVRVDGGGTPAKVLENDESGATKESGAHEVKLERHDEHFVVEVKTDGEASTLEPYLGAAGHLVIAREGAKELVHTHPSGDGAGGKLEFHAKFPGPGRYRAFAQMRPGGELITVPFALHVEGEPDDGGGHHGH